MLIIGIDGGGTKTDAVLCDEKGHVIQRARGGASNPTSMTLDAAMDCIRGVLEQLLENHGGLNASVDSLFAGISGGGAGNNPPLIREYLIKMLPECKAIDNGNDAINALRSAIPEGDALVAISGTGSCMFACVDGRMLQTGGWGYLLGDEGSGFDLGRRALMAALFAFDGRGEATGLTEACAKKLGIPVHKAIPAIYAGGRSLIAEFAPVLLKQAENNDKVALKQLDDAVNSIAEGILAAGAKLDQSIKPLALAGSVWKNTLYREMLKKRLGSSYVFCETDLPPVYGSFVVALSRAGISVSPEMEQNFRQTLPC